MTVHLSFGDILEKGTETLQFEPGNICRHIKLLWPPGTGEGKAARGQRRE